MSSQSDYLPVLFGQIIDLVTKIAKPYYLHLFRVWGSNYLKVNSDGLQFSGLVWQCFHGKLAGSARLCSASKRAGRY